MGCLGTALLLTIPEKFKDDLNSRFYLELAAYYFDECYNLHDTNKDYPDISLELMEKAIDKDSKIVDDHSYRLLYALLLMYAKRKKHIKPMGSFQKKNMICSNK